MELESRASSLRMFVLLSLALHIAAGAMLYSIRPAVQRGPDPPYFVRLLPPPEPVRPSAPETEVRPEAGPKPVPKPVPGKRSYIEPEEAPEVLRGTAPPAERAARAAPKGGGKSRDGGKAPGREGLFDREVLEGVVARKDAAKPSDGSITFDTREIRYYGYMEKLKDKIESTWVYPGEAQAGGMYGDLVIRFVIRKDGTLGAVRLLRTSGRPVLDRAAMAALRDSEPFWPLPDGWEHDSLTVTGHFIYTLYGGYYVR